MSCHIALRVLLLLCVAAASASAQVRQPPRTGTAQIPNIIATIQLDPPPARANDPIRSNTVRYTGGEWLGATVTLVNPAPAGGIRLDFRSSNTAVADYAGGSFTAQSGATSLRLNIKTMPVLQDTPVTFTASYNGDSATALLLVLAPRMVYFLITANSALGGDSLEGRVRFSGPPPNPNYGRITLSSSVPAATSIPYSITVPVGVMDMTFKIHTRPVARDTTARLTGTWSGRTFDNDLTIRAPTFIGFNCQNNCTTLAMPTNVPFVQYLNGRAGPGGVTIGIKSSDPRVVVPSPVTIPHNQQGTNFLLVVPVSASPFSATLSASAGPTTLHHTLNYVLPDISAHSIHLLSQNNQAIQTPPALTPFQACVVVRQPSSPMFTGTLPPATVRIDYASSTGTGRTLSVPLTVAPYTGGTACTILPGLDVDQYHDIEFVVDATNAIPERKENNNSIKTRINR